MAEIAVVSFDRFPNGDYKDRLAVANEVKRFFQLPLEQKLRWKLNDAKVNQGYTADGAEANGGRDHKECYEHRRTVSALCSSEDELPGFRRTLDEFYVQCLSLSLNVLRCLAMAMKLGDDDDDFFDRIITHADPQLRLLHYPAIARSVVEAEGHARIMPHTDFGICTLLFQDSIGGLEVDPFHTGEFKPAAPIPGTALVNIGDLLQRLTNNRVRSTRHRVVAPPSAVGDVLPARYSIAFFVHPDPETVIEPITLSPGEEKLYPPINAGILLLLDIASLFQFRQVNIRAREVVSALVEYRSIADHALGALRAVLRTGIAPYYTIRDFYTALCTRDCLLCGVFGGFIFLPSFTSSRRKRNLRPVLATVAEIDAGVDHSAWDIFHE
ncbi:hypothetical protein M432DRAFT_640344 [Thermoascus aurantiacus ATCC 26904]